MRDFRSVADRLAAEIRSGTLRPGTRLPPQRVFAYQQGIAASTASRVYAELARRGLVAGEVGRGTYVRAGPGRDDIRSAEPADAPVDLQLSVSLLPEQIPLMTAALGALGMDEALAASLGASGPAGRPGARETIAGFLASAHWCPDPGTVYMPANGRQAIAAALSALAKPGDRVGVEPLTYPVVKAATQRLGIVPVPLRIGAAGVDVVALRRLHAQQPLAALYLQPTLHNPLGGTMDEAARVELAAFLAESGLTAIEDAVYAFLKEVPPLAAFAPRNTVYVDSLSKRVAPGTGLGFVVAPPAIGDRLAAAMRAGSWIASSLPAAIGLDWMRSGVAARIADMKRADALRRQAIAREMLDGYAVQGDEASYFLWLLLPARWRADAFTAAAARRGVAITPASAFAVAPGHAPNAVRIATSAPPLADLRRGLAVIRSLLADDPGDVVVE